MSRRPTPETDACKSATRGESIFDLCERLERERDEARKAFVIATDQMVIAQSNLREANKERDEARFSLKAAQSTLDAIHLEVGGWIKIIKGNTD
jgi:hypothetical protein